MLYFNYNFNKERIPQFLNNKDENVKDYIFKGLIDKKYCSLFSNLHLTKEQISYLINLSLDFEQLNISLKYSQNLLELLQVISENFKKCCDLCKTELDNKKKPSIDVESIITIQKDDDINEI